jgi:hypothetical protein
VPFGGSLDADGVVSSVNVSVADADVAAAVNVDTWRQQDDEAGMQTSLGMKSEQPSTA